MLALALLAEIVARPPRISAPATATVRIERAVSVRAKDWNRPSEIQRREVERKEDGRPILLRLIEHP